MATTKKMQKMKFKKAPGAPKRFKSAYMFFSEQQHKMHRAKAAGKKIRAADVAKLVSQAWKDLSDADRCVWLEKGRRDRERYEREKAAYKGPWKIPDVKDDSAPKKPMSAFLAFGNERRGIIAEANPNFTGTEISGLLSKLWKECPTEIKQAYRDREAAERVEFKKKLAEWERQRDAELVSEYQNNGGCCNTSGNTGGNTTWELREDETSQETPQSSQSYQEPVMTFSFQQCVTSLAEKNIPTEIEMPSSVTADTGSNSIMVSDCTLEEYLPDEAWPFNRIPCVDMEPMQVQSSSSAAAAFEPVKRFENYSMEDLLQDDELFFEDFSPSQVISNSCGLARQTSLATFLASL